MLVQNMQMKFYIVKTKGKANVTHHDYQDNVGLEESKDNTCTFFIHCTTPENVHFCNKPPVYQGEYYKSGCDDTDEFVAQCRKRNKNTQVYKNPLGDSDSEVTICSSSEHHCSKPLVDNECVDSTGVGLEPQCETKKECGCSHKDEHGKCLVGYCMSGKCMKEKWDCDGELGDMCWAVGATRTFYTLPPTPTSRVH